MPVLCVGPFRLQIDYGHRSGQQPVQPQLGPFVEREGGSLVEHGRLQDVPAAPIGLVCAIGCDPEGALRGHLTLLCHQGAKP